MALIKIGETTFSVEEFVLKAVKLRYPDDNILDSDAISFLQFWMGNNSTINVKTSGSTGSPKLIQLTKKQLKSSANATISHFNLKKTDTLLLCVPCKFIAGKMMIVRALQGDMALCFSPAVSNPLKHINTTEKFDFAAMTPMQVSNIISETPEKLKQIKKIIIGGGPISNTLEKQLKKNCTTGFYHTYGMTETCSHVAVRKINGDLASNIYSAVTNITFSVDDKECLIIHAPSLIKIPLVTNDIVQLIDSSHFIWVGRIDNAINSGGIKIFPEKIETVLQPLIKQSFIIAGVQDETLSEKVILLLEGKYNTSAKNKIYSICTKILSKYEVPKEIVEVEKFIRTSNEKINRKQTLLQYRAKYGKSLPES